LNHTSGNTSASLKRWLDITVVILFACAVLFPLFTSVETQVNLAAILTTPSLEHPLGTDNLGRDLLFRILQVFQTTVLPLWGIVVSTSLIGLLLSVLTICLLQFLGRDYLLSVPYFFALVVTSVPVGIAALLWSVALERTSLWNVALALGSLFSLRLYLQVLDHYQQDRRLAFWQAHQSLGGTLIQRLLNYGILTTWRKNIFEVFCFHLQAAIVIEAGLSYLGFGIQEPNPSFGNMLASHYDTYLRGDWWVLSVIVAALGISALFPACFFRFLIRK